MFEYVKKSEYAPVRKELERIIKCVQIEMREKYGLTFQFQLIGSGKRHLVTRVCGGNSGYDFDYNLSIQRWGNMHYNAKTVKQSFMAALKNALRGTPYSSPKDSTSAITIKVVDRLFVFVALESMDAQGLKKYMTFLGTDENSEVMRYLIFPAMIVLCIYLVALLFAYAMDNKILKSVYFANDYILYYKY